MLIEHEKYNSSNPFKPFIFIGEKLKTPFPLPKIISPNFILKVANSLQIEAIKKIVQPDKLLARHSQAGNPTNIYEYEFVKSKSEHGYTYSAIPLGSVGFEYWIIELSEYLADPILVESIYLMTKNLTVIAEIGTIVQHINHYLISAVYYSDPYILFREPTDLNESDIEELHQLYLLINKFKSSDFEKTFIGKALMDYRDTLDIENSSPFKIIALFSIIETLLTSNQKNNENSINRQLQKKIMLINNQLDNKINFFEYFKGPHLLAEETIIEKLYYYRSKIAHGDYYDFENDLQILLDHKATFTFLTLLLKRILVFSMRNPRLIIDLKEC
jgi:hypothetical protein